MKCPVCKDMDLTMSSRQNIEIDYCPQCRGVWLDRGELDKLIERSAQETSPTPQHQQPSPPVRDYDRTYSGYEKRYKKKSFWHEIFD
ncbi:zf-TFIIB domain-containing protein [Castellaniella denitrificans]|uniref:Zf-TFIIB domain-containing protein n=1 Tax=Castellaniella denitrificans TaxID=56119 RepID=A0ABT4M6Z1_9BURK|nr:zf-TFIIB domain-containing protein [Castellaniella denitrificans]MCZ4331086.1 zf-TFIIB domain-containing protein [Castellaniella denitrificans]